MVSSGSSSHDQPFGSFEAHWDHIIFDVRLLKPISERRSTHNARCSVLVRSSVHFCIDLLAFAAEDQSYRSVAAANVSIEIHRNVEEPLVAVGWMKRELKLRSCIHRSAVTIAWRGKFDAGDGNCFQCRCRMCRDYLVLPRRVVPLMRGDSCKAGCGGRGVEPLSGTPVGPAGRIVFGGIGVNQHSPWPPQRRCYPPALDGVLHRTCLHG